MPASYLQWMVENFTDRTLVAAAQRALDEQQQAIRDRAANRFLFPVDAAARKKQKAANSYPKLEDTHYLFTMPTGATTWIPNGVSMDGREGEECPFDSSSDIVSALKVELV